MPYGTDARGGPPSVRQTILRTGFHRKCKATFGLINGLSL
nr:MAG TPA: hypothetical protein [Caudoviricetes sp.]